MHETYILPPWAYMGTLSRLGEGWELGQRIGFPRALGEMTYTRIVWDRLAEALGFAFHAAHGHTQGGAVWPHA